MDDTLCLWGQSMLEDQNRSGSATIMSLRATRHPLHVHVWLWCFPGQNIKFYGQNFFFSKKSFKKIFLSAMKEFVFRNSWNPTCRNDNYPIFSTFFLCFRSKSGYQSAARTSLKENVYNPNKYRIMIETYRKNDFWFVFQPEFFVFGPGAYLVGPRLRK